MQGLTLSLKQKARLELNEYEEFVPEAINKFRRLLADVENLRCPLSDDFLLRFLRARKFNLEASLKLLKQHYRMKKENPILFKNLNPKTLMPLLDYKYQLALSQKDKLGRQIFVFRAGIWNHSEVTLDDIFRCNYLYLEEMTAHPEIQINGIIGVVDFNGFSFNQARQLTPSHAQRIVNLIQDSFPCRFQEFHIVNQPYVFNMMYSIMKPFLSEKVKNRVFLYGNDLASLYKTVGIKQLPTFLGGFVDWEADWKSFTQQLISRNEHYEALSQYGYITV